MHERDVLRTTYWISGLAYVLYVRQNGCPCKDDWKNGFLTVAYVVLLLCEAMHIDNALTKAFAMFVLILTCKYTLQLADVDCQTCHVHLQSIMPGWFAALTYANAMRFIR